MSLDSVIRFLSSVSVDCLGVRFFFRVEKDNEFENGRVFIQARYNAPCSKTGVVSEWGGRKWYLSKHMTEDEIVKTAYIAFESAVKHEVMEGFKIGGVPLFNPHANYKAILKSSIKEVRRK